MILEEPSISFVEIAFLGVNISRNQLERTRSTWEGSVVKIHFDNLATQLCTLQDWTPSGLLHILLWLALDAPNSKANLKFCGKDAATQLEAVIKHLG